MSFQERYSYQLYANVVPNQEKRNSAISSVRSTCPIWDVLVCSCSCSLVLEIIFCSFILITESVFYQGLQIKSNVVVTDILVCNKNCCGNRKITHHQNGFIIILYFRVELILGRSSLGWKESALGNVCPRFRSAATKYKNTNTYRPRRP